MTTVDYRSEVNRMVAAANRSVSKVNVSRSEVNETLVEVIGQYVAAVYDDVMPNYVTVGDGKNYSSSITNVSLVS